MMPLELLKTEKGKEKLLDSNYLYIKDKENCRKTLWKCENFQKLKCRARLHSIDDRIVQRLGVHNHAPDAAKVEVSRAMQQAKQMASNTQESNQQIVAQAFSELSTAAAGIMPSRDSLKRTLRNVRSRANLAPSNQISGEELLDIPQEYIETNTSEPFLLDDGGYIQQQMKRSRISQEQYTEVKIEYDDHDYLETARSVSAPRRNEDVFERKLTPPPEDNCESFLGNGKNLKEQSKEIILNVYKYFKQEKKQQRPLLPLAQVLSRVSAATGVSVSTVCKICKKKNYGVIPRRKKPGSLKKSRRPKKQRRDNKYPEITEPCTATVKIESSRPIKLECTSD